MKRRKISPMAKSDLETLPTKRLVARLKRLNQCEESLAMSDREISEYEPSGFIEFKDGSEWIAEYNCLKDILSQREHIPSKK
jgi:hypothetical protein